MEQEITIQQLAEDENVSIGYSDDDIVIIDNIKMLADPGATRVNSYLLALAFSGRAQARLQGRPIEIGKNQMVVLPPNVMLSDFMLSPDFEFKALLITTRMLQSFLREKMGPWNELMYVRHLHVLTLDDKDIDFFIHFYEMLRICIDLKEIDTYKTEMIQSLLRSGFLGLCGRLEAEANVVPTVVGQSSSASLFQRFLSQLGTAKVKHRSVESYASELCVTPKYLSAVCKKHSGKTANEWITEHVMEDIRFHLCHTDYSIKQICALLGFPNSSFFGKYVREHFGMTPIQLRKS